MVIIVWLSYFLRAIPFFVFFYWWPFTWGSFRVLVFNTWTFVTAKSSTIWSFWKWGSLLLLFTGIEFFIETALSSSFYWWHLCNQPFNFWINVKKTDWDGAALGSCDGFSTYEEWRFHSDIIWFSCDGFSTYEEWRVHSDIIWFRLCWTRDVPGYFWWVHSTSREPW